MAPKEEKTLDTVRNTSGMMLRAVLILMLSIASVQADWSHVRGPQYDAHSSETGLVDSWPATGPPVLWVRELGPGYSAFTIANSRAFTLYQSSSGMHLLALDIDTGAELWKERVDWPWQPGGQYPGPYASPTIHDGKVFYATPSGIVGCRTADAGNLLWSVNVRERFGGSRGTEFGFASTPTVEDGRVYLPVGGLNASMVALAADDGRTLWARGDDPASYCPAYPITLDGRRVIVGYLQNVLVLLDAATGDRLWREPVSSTYDEHSAWPIFDGCHLFIAAPFRAGSRLIRFENSFTAKTVWSGRQLSNDVASSLFHDGALYGFDITQAQSSTHRPAKGTFKCLDFLTGKQHWETDRVGQASVIHADGKLILWSETGTLILARAYTERYDELARAKLLGGGGVCWAAPALAGKRLIVRDHKQAVCVYLGAPEDLDPNREVITLRATDSFDWTRLVPAEPEFANDAPRAVDVATWYGTCLGCVVIAALANLLIRGVKFFAITAFLLGAVGTTALGYSLNIFILTWPLALFVCFRAVLALGLDRGHTGWRHQVLARLSLVLFVLLCYGYYRLCTVVGYSMAWSFLAGFVPALPFALLAERSHRRWLWDWLGFTVYFWLSGLLPGWKDAAP